MLKPFDESQLVFRHDRGVNFRDARFFSHAQGGLHVVAGHEHRVHSDLVQFCDALPDVCAQCIGKGDEAAFLSIHSNQNDSAAFFLKRAHGL